MRLRKNFQAELGLLALLILSSALQPYCLGQDDGKTLNLFDGKSLQGWEGDLNHWRVEQGVIVGEIPPRTTLRKNTWLVWRGGELADFDLKLQVKLTGAPGANSGIQFRCQAHNVDHVAGYQADLDTGATWLGRIYDEEGRALLVERGCRVAIAADGKRRVESFAPAEQYAVLFRDNDWNDYRIVAVGEHIQVFINGTLFSELEDKQTGQRDLFGLLAFQLHSGPETKVSFRNIRLEKLDAKDQRLGKFEMREPESMPDEGIVPQDDARRDLNMGFEAGTLAGWQSTGDAFQDQPIKQDGIAQRWQGQKSNKQGDYFIGGYERVQDRGVGTLVSPTFTVRHPYASFLIGGGQAKSTRVELVQPASDGTPEHVVFTASGSDREQMQRVAVDLTMLQGKSLFVRLVDESRGGWGHLNFDDFRFHQQRPASMAMAGWRTTINPVLRHLVANPAPKVSKAPGKETVSQMFLPPGFSADVVAAEPKLHQPVAFTFDARGRLWVVEGNSYPQKRADGQGLDRILIFSDESADGSFETMKVFAAGLNLVSGLAVGHGGVWVGAAPQLLFIPDQDADDRPDGAPQVLLDGFGYADTHETLNSFVWGPDGWLYGNQGVFNVSRIGQPGSADQDRTTLGAGVWRYHPTRKTFEVFAHGGSNQWGLDYDDRGQFFMTHCRSYWGRGSTTHVMQGGHYWNQVNGGYASFISAQAPANLPWMRNFLLASARYDHGEGGAGKRGTDAVYGGHSHVGTMIYLGDNWPSEYRNHLFTHNLHGHQINHQINLPEAGGFNTVHAGVDMLFCADPQYVGVDLKYGPDGAVYISDWYDERNCHNPNAEVWDRRNGRIYRVKYDATYRPAPADLTACTDDQLVEMQMHQNDWFVRKSRELLGERHLRGKLAEDIAAKLTTIAATHPEESRRLRALWSLHAIQAIDEALVRTLAKDDSEYVRAWIVQLGVEAIGDEKMSQVLEELSARDSSFVVRRYLASAIQRVSPALGWKIATALSQQPENSTDRDLPMLLWQSVATLMASDLDRAWQLADASKLEVLRDYIFWYAAKLSDEGRNAAMARLLQTKQPDDQAKLLSLFELGVRGMRGLPEPRGWSNVADQLYDSPNAATQRAAESLGAAFRDEQLFQRMRKVLAEPDRQAARRRQALATLAHDESEHNLPIFIQLLENNELSTEVIPLLSRFDDPAVGEALITRLTDWQAGKQLAPAMEVLASRVNWSNQLLDAIAAKKIKKEVLAAYYVRQMSSLNNKSLNERLAKEWGTFGQSSAERKSEIAKLVTTFQAAPLWAYSQEEGRKHFTKLCANCHQPKVQNEALAPSLAGTAAKGIGYIVENVVDPNAVIGRDFQSRVIVTNDGRVVTGLVEKETESGITVRTATNSVTIAKTDVESVSISPNSFMPEELLKDLNDRERIELFKFLMTQ